MARHRTFGGIGSSCTSSRRHLAGGLYSLPLFSQHEGVLVCPPFCPPSFQCTLVAFGGSGHVAFTIVHAERMKDSSGFFVSAALCVGTHATLPCWPNGSSEGLAALPPRGIPPYNQLVQKEACCRLKRACCLASHTPDTMQCVRRD